MRSLSKIIKKKDADAIGNFFSRERFVEARTDDKEKRELMQKIKKQAEADAAQILNESKKQAAAEQQSAYQEGLRQGIEKVAPLEGVLTSVLKEIKEFKDSYATELEPQLVDLVVQISGKILKDKMQEDRDLIVRTVHDAFNHITDREFIRIRLNTSDYDLLNAHRQELCAKFHEIRDLELVADDNIEQGGCILETNEGHVDATMRTQIDRVFNALTCESAIAGMRVR